MIWLVKAGKHVEKCTLAATRYAHHRQCIPFVHRQIEALQHFDFLVSLPIALGEIISDQYLRLHKSDFILQCLDRVCDSSPARRIDGREK